jgi:hypothetical protein
MAGTSAVRPLFGMHDALSHRDMPAGSGIGVPSSTMCPLGRLISRISRDSKRLLGQAMVLPTRAECPDARTDEAG